MPEPKGSEPISPELADMIARVRSQFITLAQLLSEISAVSPPGFVAPFRNELDKARLALDRMLDAGQDDSFD